MSPNLRRAVLGFVAAVLAVLVAHQVMVLILYMIGWVANPPYSFRANAWGVPVLLNGMFWGGLWGVAFAFAADKIPVSPAALKGAVLGLAGPLLIGNWIVLPLIRGQAMFAGFAAQRMLIGALIAAAFGAGWALIHPEIEKRFAA
ncbi:MAG: hypothetical protein FJX57_05135 [Alphaproteobacteria bacterium]|nr:hypothetical protein [Alphaproteobacteria bacterium]